MDRIDGSDVQHRPAPDSQHTLCGQDVPLQPRLAELAWQERLDQDGDLAGRPAVVGTQRQ
jgi:hypothetical protein